MTSISEGAEKVIRRVYQILALLLVPVIILIGLPVITVIHDILLEVLGGLAGGPWASIFAWFVTFLSLLGFIGLVWFAYKFVQNGGWGIFEQK